MGVGHTGMEVTVHQALADFPAVPAVRPTGLNRGHINIAMFAHTVCKVMAEPSDIVVTFRWHSQECVRWVVDILGQNDVWLAIETRHHTWQRRSHSASRLPSNHGHDDQQNDKIEHDERQDHFRNH